MAKRKSTESGASASFLDLLCCALGGVILLLVMFSTRIKPGDATDQGEYLVVEFEFVVDGGEDVRSVVEAWAPEVSIEHPKPIQINYRPYPELDAATYSDFDFRWISSFEASAGNTNVTIHLVLSRIEKPLKLTPVFGQHPTVSNATVTIFSKRVVKTMDHPESFELSLQ